MSVALLLYEQLTEATDDKSRARAIADAFDQLEVNYPALRDAATRAHLSETELRLRKDIEQLRQETEQIRLEIKETEAKLQKEIELVRKETAQIRLEIREVESRLEVRIKDVEARIKDVESRLEVRIKDVEIRLTQAIHRQTLWVVGSVGAIVGLIRYLDWILTHLSS